MNEITFALLASSVWPAGMLIGAILMGMFHRDCKDNTCSLQILVLLWPGVVLLFGLLAPFIVANQFGKWVGKCIAR